MNFETKRFLGYVLGFILFYAPVALFQRLLQYGLTGKWQYMTIHSLCLRIPTEHFIDGKFFQYSTVSVISTIIILVSAFFFGPIFCGRLCPAGAFTEYLSRLMPQRLQIDWSAHTEIAPIRYGMLAGYVLAPFFGAALACSYCNYFLFDLLVNYVTREYFISFTSSLLVTLILWVVVFGLFTKGGRGYCNFMCPVGALQNLFHYIGSKFNFAMGMEVDVDKCVKCGQCQAACPMESISVEENGAHINVHNCIICGKCQHSCHLQAISYRRHHEK